VNYIHTGHSGPGDRYDNQQNKNCNQYQFHVFFPSAGLLAGCVLAPHWGLLVEPRALDFV